MPTQSRVLWLCPPLSPPGSSSLPAKRIMLLGHCAVAGGRLESSRSRDEERANGVGPSAFATTRICRRTLLYPLLTWSSRPTPKFGGRSQIGRDFAVASTLFHRPLRPARWGRRRPGYAARAGGGSSPAM